MVNQIATHHSNDSLFSKDAADDRKDNGKMRYATTHIPHNNKRVTLFPAIFNESMWPFVKQINLKHHRLV